VEASRQLMRGAAALRRRALQSDYQAVSRKAAEQEKAVTERVEQSEEATLKLRHDMETLLRDIDEHLLSRGWRRPGTGSDPVEDSLLQYAPGPS